MSKGRPGADSSIVVSHQINGVNLLDLATGHFGEAPLFWGRYFKNLQQLSNAEYIGRKEANLLRERNIRVLPTAQQTTKVGGSGATGAADGRGNVEDLIASFGVDYLATQGNEFLMFLDVEPTHPLSADYYSGWANGITQRSLEISGERFRVLPAVYLNRRDRATWNAVIAAAERGTECSGFWVANYGGRSDQITPGAGCAPLLDWSQSETRPDLELPAEVLIWQYSEECHGGDGFDCNMTNPSINMDELLQKLILPNAR
ncbi:MAG TPA: hypothetical protein VGO50_07970 [Pyrinomonadaceae bacterium]|jgi:hypothetical protein|nr:hypothetical protein [Pyrinomonadaceae bacterium]